MTSEVLRKILVAGAAVLALVIVASASGTPAQSQTAYSNASAPSPHLTAAQSARLVEYNKSCWLAAVADTQAHPSFRYRLRLPAGDVMFIPGPDAYAVEASDICLAIHVLQDSELRRLFTAPPLPSTKRM